MILGLLGFLKCSDTGDWPEAEFSFPCDIFCFEGTFFRSIAEKAKPSQLMSTTTPTLALLIPEGEYLLLGDEPPGF